MELNEVPPWLLVWTPISIRVWLPVLRYHEEGNSILLKGCVEEVVVAVRSSRGRRAERECRPNPSLCQTRESLIHHPHTRAGKKKHASHGQLGNDDLPDQ